MLEKTEGVINNGQSRDTGNTGYTRHRTKTNKTKNITQKTKKMSNTPASYKTPAVLLIYTVKSGKSLGSDRGKKTST